MRRLTRLEASIVQIRPRTRPSSSFLCSSCKCQGSAFSTSHAQSKKRGLFDEEKMRRRIWGTDEPQKQKDGSKPKRKRAPRNAVDPYEPAETWDGLEEVGGPGIWWRKDIPEPEVKLFIPATKITDQYELAVALYRAVVEVFALRQAGERLEFGRSPSGSTESSLSHGVRLVSSSTNGVELQFPDGLSLEDVVQSLKSSIQPHAAELDSLPIEEVVTIRKKETLDEESLAFDALGKEENPIEFEKDIEADRDNSDDISDADNILPPERDFKTLVESWDKSWLEVSLQDPEIKFAVIKRIMKLSGTFIPDSKIRSIRTVNDLLNQLVAPPKPTKLVDALVQKGELLNLPNVKVYNRRITPIDREKSVGRWKIIEKELMKRELPVTGHT